MQVQVAEIQRGKNASNSAALGVEGAIPSCKCLLTGRSSGVQYTIYSRMYLPQLRITHKSDAHEQRQNNFVCVCESLYIYGDPKPCSSTLGIASPFVLRSKFHQLLLWPCLSVTFQCTFNIMTAVPHITHVYPVMNKKNGNAFTHLFDLQILTVSFSEWGEYLCLSYT